MPNTKISNLTTAAALTGSEVAPIVQSSSTVKVTTQNIADLAPVPNATKISALSNAGSLTGTENVIITQGGTTVKTTTQAIADLTPSTSIKYFSASISLAFGSFSSNVYANTFGASFTFSIPNPNEFRIDNANMITANTVINFLTAKGFDSSFNPLMLFPIQFDRFAAAVTYYIFDKDTNLLDLNTIGTSATTPFYINIIQF